MVIRYKGNKASVQFQVPAIFTTIQSVVRLLLLHYGRTSVLNVSCLSPRLRTDRLVIKAGHHFPLKHRRRIVRPLPALFLTSCIS
jgi:hypothetical protein